MWHGYFGLENLNLNSGQRQTLISELRTLGPASDSQPARLNHWRTRLDGEAVIFEALFSESNLTVAKFKQQMADIFSVDPAMISHSTINISFDGGNTPVVTFTRSGTDQIRVALFGDVGATWQQSGNECRGYLKANQAEWEENE